MLVILLILPKYSIPPLLVYDNCPLPDDSREEHEGERKWKGSGKWGGDELINSNNEGNKKEIGTKRSSNSSMRILIVIAREKYQ